MICHRSQGSGRAALLTRRRSGNRGCFLSAARSGNPGCLSVKVRSGNPVCFSTGSLISRQAWPSGRLAPSEAPEHGIPSQRPIVAGTPLRHPRHAFPGAAGPHAARHAGGMLKRGRVLGTSRVIWPHADQGPRWARDEHSNGLKAAVSRSRLPAAPCKRPDQVLQWCRAAPVTLARGRPNYEARVRMLITTSSIR